MRRMLDFERHVAAGDAAALVSLWPGLQYDAPAVVDHCLEVNELGCLETCMAKMYATKTRPLLHPFSLVHFIEKCLMFKNKDAARIALRVSPPLSSGGADVRAVLDLTLDRMSLPRFRHTAAALWAKVPPDGRARVLSDLASYVPQWKVADRPVLVDLLELAGAAGADLDLDDWAPRDALDIVFIDY